MARKFSGRLRVVAGATVVGVALVASACSSSGGTGSANSQTSQTSQSSAPNTSGPGSTASSGTSTSASNGAADTSSSSSAPAGDVVTQMQTLIDQYKAQPTWKDPGPALDASTLKGKTIAVVAIDMRVPAISEIAQYVKAAAGKVGMNVTVFDAQSTASLMQQGMQQAINSGANAIISDGLVVQLVATQIKDAKDKGIPTIDVINTPPKVGVAGQGSDPNMFANLAPDSDLVGQLIAATAIVQTGGKAKVGIINTSELTVAPTEIGAMKDTLAKCSGCQIIAEQDVALNDWSTKIPGVAATMVRSHPDMNYMLTLYDAMAIFATTGIDQAGATGKVHIASVNGTAAALALAKDGDVLFADIADSTEWAAWGAVDQAMRGMLKMEPASPVLPIRYLDKTDLTGVDTSSTDSVTASVFGDDFRTGYLRLWGLS